MCLDSHPLGGGLGIETAGAEVRSKFLCGERQASGLCMV